jgi:hypothetical protein
MRNLLIIAILFLVLVASCKKVKCNNADIWIGFSADTIEPHHSLVTVKTYIKGADWSYPSKAETMDINFSSGTSILTINSNNNYLVEIDSPSRQYKITDLTNGNDKTYESGIGQDRINCTNSISYKVNGVDMHNKMATGDKKRFH